MLCDVFDIRVAIEACIDAQSLFSRMHDTLYTNQEYSLSGDSNATYDEQVNYTVLCGGVLWGMYQVQLARVYAREGSILDVSCLYLALREVDMQ